MRHHIGILIFPGFQLLDATGPTTVFETGNALAADGHGYSIDMLSVEGGLVASSAGVEINTKATAAIGQLDTLVVAGGSGTRSAGLNPALLDYLKAIASRCRRVASVCTGSFLLAQAGLIDGLQVTTHWRHSTLLANSFPRVKVVPDQIWINDGKFWSSAGVSSGIDLALALLTDDFGDQLAKQAAREIVVYYKRPGGQSQFSTIEELGDRANRFKPVLAWIRENITQTIKVEQLAEVAAMSPRNFSRQFQKSVGRTPAKAVEQIRIEVAKSLVESTDLNLEKIAERSGFSNGEIMRRAFVRTFGRAPRGLRTDLKQQV
jgi:transcriptional regulator GlxA family with amidase domain